jgi:ankyrin repeat domain-containing protein 50
LAFFYFSFNDKSKQQTDNLLCSIIAQLAAQSRYFLKDLQKLYENYYPGQPPLDALRIALRLILEQQGDKYIVIDALDECPSREGNRDQLCALLGEISNWDLPLLHILTTSRREPGIEEAFAQIPNISHVAIQNARVDADILQYVEAQLVTIPRLARLKPQLKEQIKESLVDGARGM